VGSKEYFLMLFFGYPFFDVTANWVKLPGDLTTDPLRQNQSLLLWRPSRPPVYVWRQRIIFKQQREDKTRKNKEDSHETCL